MEILVYEDDIEKDYQTVAVIDWQNLDNKVKKRPVILIPSGSISSIRRLLLGSFV